MTRSFTLQEMRESDVEGVATVLDSTGLFPASLIGEMAEPYFQKDAPHHWLVASEGGRVLGFTYAAPERFTAGTINLLAIAVHRSDQRRGVGQALVRGLEERLRGRGQRILIVETSGLEDYASARAFYAGLGFAQEARIRDFYRDGEDKIIFWKRL